MIDSSLLHAVRYALIQMNVFKPHRQADFSDAEYYIRLFSTEFSKMRLGDYSPETRSATEESMNEFLKGQQRFLQYDDSALGNILLKHLTCEHYLLEYLKVRIPNFPFSQLQYDNNWNLRKYLTIWQKLDKADSWDEPIIAGLFNVNTVRNKYAHDMTYEISFAQMNELKAFMDKHRPYVSVKAVSALDYYNLFCMAASVHLFVLQWAWLNRQD